MAKVVHTLPVFQKDGDEEIPGWLILTRKKSAPVAEGLDGVEGSNWDPPVKSWFIPHERISDALELIEEAEGILFCADCKDGNPCDAWEKIPRLDYIVRLAEELEQPNRARREFADIVMTWHEWRGDAPPPVTNPTEDWGWAARMYPNGAPPPPPVTDHRSGAPNPIFGFSFQDVFRAAFEAFAFFTEPVVVPARPLEQAAAVLGLTWPCTKEELNVAFKKAALQAHPDRGGSTEAMAALNNARDTLSKALGS